MKKGLKDLIFLVSYGREIARKGKIDPEKRWLHEHSTRIMIKPVPLHHDPGVGTDIGGAKDGDVAPPASLLIPHLIPPPQHLAKPAQPD